jgi:hypothetical protein
MPDSLPDKTMREHGERYAKMTSAERTAFEAIQPKQQKNRLLGCVGAVFVIVVTLGVLWLLIFVVKWMWMHS